MDYLTEENGVMAHYFCHRGDGLCRRSARGGAWQEHESILRGVHGSFGLYPDGSNLHIVAPTDNSELMYITGSSGSWRRFILKKLGDDKDILSIQIYSSCGKLHMLYSVRIENDIYLMHCKFGSNSIPDNVSKLNSGEFFISNDCVYYTLPDKCAVYSSLAGDKPSSFVRIAENSSVPYVYDGHIAFISEKKIFLDNRQVCYDPKADGIIIAEYDGRIYTVWKSGDFVRYICSDSQTNKAFSIINPSREAKLYAIWKNGRCFYLYGSDSGSELTTYINPAPFGSHSDSSRDQLRRRLEEMKQEINRLRRQLADYS